MNLGFIRKLSLPVTAPALLFALTIGCSKKVDDKRNFTNAIDNYYSAHPSCLWPTSIKFPVQAETSDTSKTQGFDALVDQGLLVRTTGEKKVMIIASKQVNNYDLSDKGRSAWTADVTQPGFGNFCYGHRKTVSIDSSTLTSSAVGATTQVAYHYTMPDVPPWATAAETQNAYPRVRSEVATPQISNATLINTNNGWQVGAPGKANPDGQIVE
jgi:hypothetical protein